MHHNRWCTEWNSGLQWGDRLCSRVPPAPAAAQGTTMVQSIAGAEYSGVREHWCRSILESSEWWLAEQSNIGASAKQQAAGFPDTRSSPTFPQHRCISSFPTIEAHQRFPTTEAGISSFPIMVHGKQKPNDQIRYFADRQG